MAAKKASRLGVGAAPITNQPKDDVAGDWVKSGKKQILSIGRKRRRDDGDDDDDDYDSTNMYGDNGSSDEEEEGRTSAIKERKRKVPHLSISKTNADTGSSVTLSEPTAPEDAGATDLDATSKKKKKKKKKGKKERMMEATETNELSKNIAAETVPAPAQPNEKLSSSLNDSDMADAKLEHNDQQRHDENDKTKSAHKRKRKKSRSRQKNIRKDHRSAQNKPTHLILGRSEYSGRPLTKETRQKIGMPIKSFPDGDVVKANAALNNQGNAKEIDGSILAASTGDNIDGRNITPSLSEPNPQDSIVPIAMETRDDVGRELEESTTQEHSIEHKEERRKGTKRKSKEKKKKLRRKFKNLAIG